MLQLQICASGSAVKNSSEFQKVKLHYAASEAYKAEGREKGMRNWAVRGNLRYKDNGCFICFPYGLRSLNSWPLFAFVEYGVRAEVQHYGRYRDRLSICSVAR